MKTKQSKRRRWQGAAVFAALAILCLSSTLLAVEQSASNAPGVEALDAKKNAWELYKAGGFFMIPLTACSVLAVAIIIERFVALRRGAVIPRGFMPGLKEMYRDVREDRDAALNYCRKFDAPLSRMIAAGIKRMPRGWSAAEKAIEDTGSNEALKLRRNMRFLYAIGSVATLLGLIGTISGMIIAFQNAAASGTGDVHKLSTGIYEAMVNTFGGLAVGIVVTLFYYYFVGKIERYISEMNDLLSDFSDTYGMKEDREFATAEE